MNIYHEIKNILYEEELIPINEVNGSTSHICQ